MVKPTFREILLAPTPQKLTPHIHYKQAHKKKKTYTANIHKNLHHIYTTNKHTNKQHTYTHKNNKHTQKRTLKCTQQA